MSRAIDISSSGWQSRAYQFESRNLKFTAEFETNVVSQNAAYAGLHFFVHHILNNGQKILVAHVLYSLCEFAFSDCLCFNCACTHTGKVREVRTCTSEQSAFALTGIIEMAAAQRNENTQRRRAPQACTCASSAAATVSFYQQAQRPHAVICPKAMLRLRIFLKTK